MKKMLPAPLQSLIVKTSAFLICVVASAFLFGKVSAQNQVIGSFPTFHGGFENVTATSQASTTLSSGSQLTAWTGATTTNTAQSNIITSNVRSGSKSLDWATNSSSGLMYSPTAPTTAVLNTTSYVVQFYWWKNNTANARALNVAIGPDGSATLGSNGSAGTLGSNSVASTSWTKSTTVVTSGTSAANPRYGLVRLQFSGGAIGSYLFDDFVVYAGSAADVTAPSEATGASATVQSTTSIDVNWTGSLNAGDGGGYVLVRSTTATPVTLNQNGIYGVGSTSATGGGTVVAIVPGVNGTNTFSDVGLTTGVTYYYSIFAADKAFNYAAAATTNGTPVATNNPEPTNYPTGFSASVSATSNSQGQIVFDWTDAIGTDLPSGYLIRGSDVGYGSIVNPADGTPIADGGLDKNAFYGVQTTSISGLNSNTTYYFKIFSFANSGATIDYKTDGTPPEATAMTASNSTASDHFRSLSNGGWNSISTWQSSPDNSTWVTATLVPTSSATSVLVRDGHTVTIDAAGLTSGALTIGEGASGILQFEQTTARTFTVTGNTSIALGGTFRSNNAGTQTGHILSISGNMIINGTLDFSTNSNTAAASITCTGSADQTISGTGATADFWAITMSKDVLANIVELNLSNFSVRGLSTAATGALITPTSGTGTIKFSGTNTFNGNVVSGTPTIGSNMGIWINNPNFTVNGQSNTTTLNGLLRITAGTYNVGTSNNSCTWGDGAVFTMEGGAFNVAARLAPTSATSANSITFTMSGGTLTTAMGSSTPPNTSGSIASFDIPATGSSSSFTMSGGTIVMQKVATAVDFRMSAAGTVNITGGTVQFGNASTTGSPNFQVGTTSGATNVFPNVVINTNGTPTVTFNTAATVNGNVTINSGTTLNANSKDVSLTGNWINSGTFTSGTNTTTFNGASQQQYTRTGSGTFSGLTVNNATGLLLNNSLTASGTLTLTNGKVTLGANDLTCNALSGGSSSNYVVTNGAGALKINGVGASDFLFPVGPTASSYNPLIINNAGTADNLSVRVLTTLTNAPIDPTKVVNREWIVTEDVAGGSDATLTAQWNASEEAASFNNAGTVVVARHNGASYVERSATVAGTDPYTATATGFTDFSPFVVGNAGAFSNDATILVDQTGFISNFGNVITGTNSAERQYSISGMNLTDDITVTAPAGFEVSKTSTTGFNSSIIFAQTGGTVAASDVFVRFSPTAATGATGSLDITHTSNLAVTKNLAVSGNAIATEPTTIGTITFGTATATTIPVNLPTIGDGNQRIIVAKLGSAPDAPLGGTAYAANAAFGSGTTTGAGSYVVYDGTGSGNDVVTVTGLNANTTYYFAVYEYNVGSGTSQNYLTSSFASGNQMTADGTLATDFFRSFTSGDWNVAGTWESSHDGSTNWIGATIFPDFSSSGITILNTHTVTVTANVTVDELTIAAGGQVDVNNGVTLTVNNGTGTDISVSGTLKNSGTVSNTGSIAVENGGVYDHNLANATLPTIVWNAGSTLKVSGNFTGGGVGTTHATFGGTYKNLLFAPSISTADSYISINGATIEEKLTIESTGNGAILANTGTATTCGSLEQTGGILYINRQGGGTRTLTVFGNVNITGGVTYLKINATSGSTSVGQLIVGGNLTIGPSATIANAAISSGTVSTIPPQIIFNAASGDQTYVNSGTVTNAISVIIDKAAGKVVLGSDIPVTGALTFTSGKLSIGSHTLTLSGTTTGGSASNSLIGGSTSNLVINGTGDLGTLFFDQTTDGTTNAISNFTLNRTSGGAAALGNKLVLLSIYTPTAGTLAAGGFLHLRSTASNTARIAQGAPGGGYITGNVVAERYISGIGIYGNPSAYNRAYRMLTPVVTTPGTINANWQEGQTNTDVNTIINTNPGYGTQITGAGGAANGFDPTLSNSSSLYTFNAVTPAWVAATNTNVATLNAKTGYLLYIRGNRSMDMTSTASPLPATNTTLRATGTLLTGTQTFASLQGSGKYNLVTNPFASPVDWASIYGANSADFENYYTFWDPNQGSRGAFVTVTSGGIVSAGDATTSIQSGQAFFVKALPGAGSPTLTVSETHKTTINNIDVFRNGSTEQFRTSLYFNDGFVRRLADGVVNVYDNNYSAEVDGRDALQMANWDEDIAIARSGNALSIETRPLIDVADTIFLSVARLKQQPYQWQFDPSSFNAPGLQAYLQDKFLNNEIPVSLSAQTLVDFTVTADAASAAADRFRIVFRSSAPLPVKITKVKATDKQTAIQVEWNTAGEFEMDKYVVEKSNDGREFVAVASVLSKNIANATTYSWMDIDRVTGSNYYRIRSVSKNGQATVSEVVRVNVGKGKDGITVYPNPIVGDVVAVQLNNVASGKYSIVITNKLGQQVSVTSFDHAGGSASQTISLPKAATPGIYQLQVIGNGAKYELQILKN